MQTIAKQDIQNVHGGLLVTSAIVATGAAVTSMSSTTAGLLVSAAATSTLALGATALSYSLEKLGQWLD